MEWLHLRPYLSPPLCGACSITWNWCWPWGIPSSPRAAAPATLSRGKVGMKMDEWIKFLSAKIVVDGEVFPFLWGHLSRDLPWRKIGHEIKWKKWMKDFPAPHWRPQVFAHLWQMLSVLLVFLQSDVSPHWHLDMCSPPRNSWSLWLNLHALLICPTR